MKIDENTYAWIFLAAGLGSDRTEFRFNEIEGIADGINHAVPTHEELQRSFRWLRDRGLVAKSGKKYRLTAKGARLLTKATSESRNLFEQRAYIESDFRNYPQNTTA